MDLSVLRRNDSHIDSIISTTTHVALYVLKESLKNCRPSNIEVLFFIAQKVPPDGTGILHRANSILQAVKNRNHVLQVAKKLS